MYIVLGLLLSLGFLATAETVAVAAVCFLAITALLIVGGLYYLVKGYLPERKPGKE